MPKPWKEPPNCLEAHDPPPGKRLGSPNATSRSKGREGEEGDEDEELICWKGDSFKWRISWQDNQQEKNKKELVVK